MADPAKATAAIPSPETLPDGPELTPNEILVTWRAWVERGPQGPIEDEGEPAFPDATR